MTYAIEDLARTLKRARERKGLSQRALGARAGVYQNQISKIESGTVDLRLSSLLELARALELDLKLVPRKAVPAVDAVVRGSLPRAAATPALKEINRTLDALRNLRAAYPDLSELAKLQSSLQALMSLQGTGKDLEPLREITRPVRDLRKLTEQFRKIGEAAKLSAEQLQALRHAAEAAQSLRNRLVHTIPEAPSPPPPPLRPAYRLDEDDNG